MIDTPRILIVRRDNIGDLLCTTPLLHALRRRYPKAYIAVLVSDYNAPILERNPDIDEVFVFIQRRHRRHGIFATTWRRWKVIREIRQRRFDYVLLANGGLRFGRKLGGRLLIGFRERDNSELDQPDVVVPLENRGRNQHEVEKMARLGTVFGLSSPLDELCLLPDVERIKAIRLALQVRGWCDEIGSVAVHISSRQPIQRWPEESFCALIEVLRTRHGLQVLLFWSPGSERNPAHPGDDEKAARILACVGQQGVYPCSTETISDLVAALSLADSMVCSDGGAMHVAAALGKPIVCLFGHSNSAEWRPWQTRHILLQSASRRVADIDVAEVEKAFLSLGFDIAPKTEIISSCGKL